MKTDKLFKKGQNCWRIEHAERAAFVVDGRDYFRALYAALPATRQQFLILSWDIDSKFELVRGCDAAQEDNGHPCRLGELLDNVVRQNSDIHGFVLNWDYNLLLSTARESLPMLKFDWVTHERLHFVLDDQIPLGGCHHQKVVVIDDSLAFSGGLDITRGRWDTPEHDPDDDRRREPSLPEPRPYHDIQMAVSGDVARALGDLARERWRKAQPTESESPVEVTANPGLWPDSLNIDVEDIDVAISRTIPGSDGSAVDEVEQLFIDSIQAAEDYIYIENQYLTADTVIQALKERLQQAHGPDIVMVTPLMTDGWVAQHTMDRQREDMVRQLLAADEHDRLAVYYPRIAEPDDLPLNVHAKIMIADNEFVRIGSANISNRSMRLDSECDLSIFEKERPDIQRAIENFRDRLLSEHLSVSVELVSSTLKSATSFKAGVEALRLENRKAGRARNLVPLAESFAEQAITLPGQPLIFDPLEPVDAKRLFQYVIKTDSSTSDKPIEKRFPWSWLAVLLFFAAMSLAWKMGPLEDMINTAELRATAEQIKSMPYAPLVAMLTLVLANLVMLPLTLLAIAMVLVFGLLQGFLLCLSSAIASAILTYALGAWLGGERLRSLAGNKVNEVSKKLARRGILSVTALRLVPVAPFSVINLVAGASHISLRDFIAGSILGLTPGMFALMFLVDQFRNNLESARIDHLLIGIAGAGLAIVAGYFLAAEGFRRMAERNRDDETGG